MFAHGFLLSRGEKMSKSLGNVVDPMALAERFGVDALRYFLLREVPFGQDGSYSAEAIVARANAELANSFGNLAQRTLSMVVKNLDSVLPAPGEAALDRELLALVEEATRKDVPEAFDRFAFSVGSWGIILHKFVQISRARSESERFLAIFWESKNLATIHSAGIGLKRSPIAQVFRAGYQE